MLPAILRNNHKTWWDDFPWTPDEMSRWMQNEFNRMFAPFAKLSGRLLSAATPALNVWEDDHNLYAEADLPGLNPESVEVFVTEGNKLTIQGERKPSEVQGAVWHRQERPTGQFTRILTLPCMIDADKVTANYEHGVLRITLPKSEAAKPRKIAVNKS